MWGLLTPIGWYKQEVKQKRKEENKKELRSWKQIKIQMKI